MTVYDEFHLYSNKTESIIKGVIWIFLWLSGVISILKSLENNISDNASVIATAYFMFSLSMMMEFFNTIISRKKKIMSKLFHGFFATLLISTLVLSGIIIFTPVKCIAILNILYYISISTILCISLDVILTLFFDTVSVHDIDKNNIEVQKMATNSKTGSLGNINK